MQENTKHCDHTRKKSSGNRNCFWVPRCQTSYDFKAAIINVNKELKENMYKEVKESTITISHQIENISKGIEIEPNKISGVQKYTN